MAAPSRPKLLIGAATVVVAIAGFVAVEQHEPPSPCLILRARLAALGLSDTPTQSWDEIAMLQDNLSEAMRVVRQMERTGCADPAD